MCVNVFKNENIRKGVCMREDEWSKNESKEKSLEEERLKKEKTNDRESNIINVTPKF
jgi:hypothetical protein